MRRVLLPLLAVSLVCQNAFAVQSGVTGSLDIKAIESAKAAYFDVIVKEINKVKIPDIDFDKGHMNGNQFAVS